VAASAEKAPLVEGSAAAYLFAIVLNAVRGPGDPVQFKDAPHHSFAPAIMRTTSRTRPMLSPVRHPPNQSPAEAGPWLYRKSDGHAAALRLRRAKASMPTHAAIRPGRPAPTTGLGTLTPLSTNAALNGPW
jgi:hypothetical protein